MARRLTHLTTMTENRTSDAVDVVTIGLMVSDVAVRTFSEMPARGLIAWVDYIGAHAGGDALNEAVVAARLGVRVRLIGKVGCDAFGDFLIRHVADEGVDVAGIVRSETDRTGACVVLVGEDGERSFLFQPGANDTLDDTDVDVSLFAGARCVSVASAFALATLEGPRLARVLQEARRSGAMTFLDLVWDKRPDWRSLLAEVVPHVDYLVPSYDEAVKLADETDLTVIGRALCDMGARTTVVKCGDDGAYAFESAMVSDASYRGVRVPGFAVDAVDTTGAGDSFVGGLMVALARGDDLRDALRFACAVGALVVQHVGAHDGAPSMNEVTAFLKEHA